MPVIQLCPKFLKSLTTEPGKSRTEWCDKNQPGLYVEARATAHGQGTFYLRYKDSGGKTCHVRLGHTDSMSLAEARTKAKDMQSEIRQGADPSLAKKQKKQVPTFRQFVEEQYLPYIKPRKRSYRDDELRLNARLIPALGHLPLNAITRKQLVDFHLEVKNEGFAAATCDHYIKLVRYIFNLAIQWDVVATNPAAKIALFNEDNKVHNLLTDEQFSRLLTVLHTHPNRPACQVALFLLSTGARMNEALTATWEQIDLQKMTWHIPATNTKSKKLRVVPLNQSALEVLEKVMPAEKTGWVFLNASSTMHIKNIQNAWRSSIRTTAGLPHLRIHDLRHCFASLMVNSGRTLYEVQNLLGHSTPQISTRYAHLSTSTLKNASEAASDKIRAATPRLLPAPLAHAS